MTSVGRRLGAWSVGGLAVLLAALPPDRLAGQDSQFGIRGLGTPERWESIRARTTGGAFGLFDQLSPAADAALATLGRLSASAGAAASYRTARLDGQEASLRGTRFPIFTVAGPVRGNVTVGGGFGAYLGRSYRVETRDSVVLRGEVEPYRDEITSDGGISDLRAAVGWRVSPRLALGGAFHILTGSTRVTAIRRFDDSLTYRAAGEVDELRYDGLGGSASLLVTVSRRLQLAAYLRSDTRLRYKTRDTIGAYDLPITWAAAVRWQPGTQAGLAAAVQSSSWSAARGLPAHDVFAWSLGVEVGRPSLPLRLGVRGGDLPFGPGAEPPRETGVSLGTGFRFSGGRGIVDLGVERLTREGGGLEERVWTVLVGITVRP